MNSPRLAEAYSQYFLEGGAFTTIVDARHHAATILGKTVAAGTNLAKQVEESLEAGLVRTARTLIENSETPQQAYSQLVDLYQRQPTLGTRSSTSVLQQAYSTPLPIAYLAATLAEITLETTVYEPTAGHGALLLTSDPGKAIVNELNPDRAADLRAQGYTVSEQNAATYLPDIQSDVVILNPPFGSVPDSAGKTQRFKTGRYSTSKIDHAIALVALKAMKPNGKAVLILGGNLGTDEGERSKHYNSQESRAFYYTLYNEYNVRQHFSILGDLYRKQGAGFPIDLILIAGQGKSDLLLPAADVPKIYKSFDELGGVLNEFLLSQSQRLESARIGTNFGSSRSRDDEGDQQGAVSILTEPESQLADLSVDGKPASQPGRNSSNAAQGLERVRAKSEPWLGNGWKNGRNAFRLRSLAGGMGQDLGDRQRDHPHQLVVSGGELSGLGRDRSSTGGMDPLSVRGVRGRDSPQSGGMANRANLSVEGDLAMTEPDKQVKQVPYTAKSQERSVDNPLLSLTMTEPDKAVKQVPYTAKSQGRSVNTLVPVNMQAAIDRALEQLEQRVGSIDEYVADRLGYGTSEELHKYFSAEQIDACALAIANLEKRSGFIIGDQTGIGKGRVVAAMIRYANLTGRTPIFITKDPALYSDMIRDLGDINLPHFKPFATNGDLKQLPLPDGRVLKTTPKFHASEMADLLRSGNLGDYDAIFTTYSQLQTVKGKETSRHEFLRAFAPNALLVLDESHEAGGSLGRDENGFGKNSSARALFVRELVELADGVFYSSATYAKRPDVMDLYAKTDMRLAVRNVSSLTWMVQQGGIPMQQALATMLTEAGQYLRRERSFEGVKFDPAIAPVNHDVAENISRIMSGVLAFDRIKRQALRNIDKELKAQAKAVLGDGSIGEAGASSTNFTSVMHNLIDQMLLALKAEATVEKSLELLGQDEPEKPVIALSGTMGAFIGQYAEINDLKPGDPINLSFGDLLHRYLERSREVLLGSPFGEKSRQRLSDEELGAEGVAEYEAVLDLIDATDLSEIPISPIDYLKFRLEGEGYRINEITGREHIIEYASNGEMTYQRRSDSERSKATAVETVRAFNQGQLDVIILNRSGSTGISLHSSEKFSDQRRRHMIVAQPERDINQFMQMLGRVHRTGQVIPPNFTLLMADIPAEKRPGAVLSKKMASLNANTTAARQSGVSLETVPDFMNEYGDLVAAEVMANFPDLHSKLDFPLSGGEELSSDDAIRKVTGRIPLLSLAEQEKLYDLIEEEYQELVKRQEAMGESILEAQTLDLDARTLARLEVSPADAEVNSPFTSAAYLEVVDAKTPRKPLTRLQVINAVRNSLELSEIKQPDEHDFEVVAEQAQQVAQERIARLDSQIAEYRQKQLSRCKNPDAITKLDDRLEKQRNRIQDLLEEFSVGQTVRIVTPNSNVFYGVSAKIWQVGQQDNPVVPSGWRMQVLLADPARELVIPFSRINTGKDSAFRLLSQEQDWHGYDIYESFDLQQVQEREQRQIFTGNLLRAFEQFPEGKLINFTDSQGQMRQGLLAPKDFDIEKTLEKHPVIMPSVGDAYRFLSEATQHLGQLKTLDELLCLKPQKEGDGFLLQTPKAKEVAGRYYLDPALLAAANNEFYSVGDRMECLFERDRLESVLETIMIEKVCPLAAFEQRELAREMLGIVLPKLEQIDLDEKVILSELEQIDLDEKVILSELEQIDLDEKVVLSELEQVDSEQTVIPPELEAVGLDETVIPPELEAVGLDETVLPPQLPVPITPDAPQLRPQPVEQTEAKSFLSPETLQPSLFSLDPHADSPGKSLGIINSSAWDVLPEEDLVKFPSDSILKAPQSQPPKAEALALKDFHDILRLLKAQLLNDEKLLEQSETGEDYQQAFDKEVQEAVNFMTLKVLNPKILPETERLYLDFYKAWHAPENTSFKQQWCDSLAQEFSTKVKAQQQGKQVASIIHNYLTNYLGKEAHQGQYHSVSFTVNSQQLLLIDNKNEQVKLKAALGSSGQWHVSEFNLSDRDLQHFQQVGEKVAQYLQNQPPRVSEVAPNNTQQQRSSKVAPNNTQQQRSSKVASNNIQQQRSSEVASNNIQQQRSSEVVLNNTQQQRSSEVAPNNIQQQRVNTVANILETYLTSLNKSEVQSVFHSVFWNAQNKTLTLIDNQSQKNIMKAQLIGNSWKDLGSCLSEEKENYFRQKLLPKIQAHQLKQQQLQPRKQAQLCLE